MGIIYNFKNFQYDKVAEYVTNEYNLDEYNINDILKYLHRKDISIIYSEMYIEYKDEFINVYRLNSYGEKIFIIKYNEDEKILGDIIKNKYDDEKSQLIMDYSYMNSKLLSFFTYLLLTENGLESINRSNSLYKVIKGCNYTQIKLKKLPVEIKIYEKLDKFQYVDYGDKVKLTVANLYQDEKVIPSKLYPLPNNSYKVFNYENTFDLEDDEVNNILSDIDFKVGRCYSNSDLILNILNRNNIKAEFYSGWVLHLNKMTHHAWIVVENKHLLDVGILRKEEEFIGKGKVNLLLSNSNGIDLFAEIISEKAPFKEKYYYGKVGKGLIYIGSPSNSTEARESYNKLIRENPNHPDYQNIDKNGVNKTQRALYKKIYNENI